MLWALSSQRMPTRLVKTRCLPMHGRQHEKIVHGSTVGVFIYYGRQEEVDETIQMFLAEKVCSPFCSIHAPTDYSHYRTILRYGGVYTLPLAYAGTSNNDAIGHVLHISVSDTSFDIRREDGYGQW
jgi:26S proteasome regulatory subunit N2